MKKIIDKAQILSFAEEKQIVFFSHPSIPSVSIAYVSDVSIFEKLKSGKKYLASVELEEIQLQKKTLFTTPQIFFVEEKDEGAET